MIFICLGNLKATILQEEGCKNPAYNETNPVGLMNVLITTRNFNIAPKNDASENVSPDSNMASFWVSICQISGGVGGKRISHSLFLKRP